LGNIQKYVPFRVSQRWREGGKEGMEGMKEGGDIGVEEEGN